MSPTEKSYGGNKRLYGVIAAADGGIELHVYHSNRAMRALLRDHSEQPAYFLTRQQAFSRSNIRAEYWLAEIMKDYGSLFRGNRVRIVLAGESGAAPAGPAPAQPAVRRPERQPSAAPAAGGSTVALVACVSEKQDRPMAARKLYDSDWFRKASAYAQRIADRWYILSAKYGLVGPEQVIAPYNETLKTQPAAGRQRWAERVLAELVGELKPGDEIVILAGSDYREHLAGALERLGYTVRVPMEGLRIGEQLAWLNQQLAGRLPVSYPPGRLGDVQRFYDLLGELERRVGGRRRLGEADGRMAWPERGVYFFFEPGETRTNSGAGARVVRVGTHALMRGSGSTLWGRLQQHRGTAGGGGNHRGSVFRQHVGAALVRRDHWPESVAGRWGSGSSAPAEVRAREEPLEQAVSQYFGGMELLWLEVGDEPGPTSLRGVIERNAIALLSNCPSQGAPLDPPSAGWLGRWAASDAVRASGLWNVNHVAEPADPGFLRVLEQLVLRR